MIVFELPGVESVHSRAPFRQGKFITGGNGGIAGATKLEQAHGNGAAARWGLTSGGMAAEADIVD